MDADRDSSSDGKFAPPSQESAVDADVRRTIETTIVRINSDVELQAFLPLSASGPTSTTPAMTSFTAPTQYLCRGSEEAGDRVTNTHATSGTADGLPLVAAKLNSDEDNVLVAASDGEQADQGDEDEEELTGFRRLQDKTILMCIATYGLTAFSQILFDELYPVLAKTVIEKGGLGFETDQVGIGLTIVGVVLIVFQMFIFPKLCDRWGILRCYIVGQTGAALAFGLFPALNLLAERPILLWIFLGLALAVKAIALAMAFVSVSLLINNSCRGVGLGTVNGAGQSTSSLVRAIGPALGTSSLHLYTPYSLQLITLLPASKYVPVRVREFMIVMGAAALLTAIRTCLCSARIWLLRRLVVVDVCEDAAFCSSRIHSVLRDVN